MRRVLRAAFGVAATAALGALLERELIASPHYHGPRSDHFDGDRFFNVETCEHSEGSFLKWQFTREHGHWRDWVDEPPGPPPPQRAGIGEIRVTFVNHATLLIQMDGVNMLTDPIWSYRCPPFASIGPRRHRAPGLRFRDLPPIDIVLLSHNHYDHLDLPTLHALRKRHRPRIITPLGNDRVLAKHGIRNVIALDWWGGTDRSVCATPITLVPAQHFSSRGISDRNRNLWGGFVIRGAAGHAYFAGDTGWGGHFERIREQFRGIRVSMLPIGAYLPRWFMAPVHISPHQAVKAHELLGASATIPMHYGTFHLGDDGEHQPLDDLRAAIAAAGNPHVVILGHGEGRDF